jgi:hypothetical protein
MGWNAAQEVCGKGSMEAGMDVRHDGQRALRRAR